MMYMHRFVFLFFLLLFGQSWATYVAVLETLSEGGLTTLKERQYLTDVLRSQAIEVLPSDKNYTIMTRENISEMLPLGKSIEDCEGSCLVETGRNIAADYVSQARISRFGKSLAISVELYETARNKLVASFNGQGKNVEDLLNVIRVKSRPFFEKIRDPENDESDKEGTIESASDIPENAHGTIYGWACNEGTFQSDINTCDSLPEHAHDMGDYSWGCDEGFQRINNQCELIPQCSSNEIYILKSNSCNPIPQNAAKLDDYSWACEDGFHENQQGTECLRNVVDESPVINKSFEMPGELVFDVGGALITNSQPLGDYSGVL